MATYEEVINGNINSLKELKDLVKSFKDELATAKEGTQEWEDACNGLAVAQERIDKINKAAKGTLDGYNKSSKDSINTLKERIKQLNTERNAMDMNSQEYADATARLKEMNDKLRESGVKAGDMRANVGNYAESLASGFAGVKDAVGQASQQMIASIGGLGTSLGALPSTVGTVTSSLGGLAAASGPVGVALAAIAAVIAVFKEGITSSEENTNKFREAMIPLKTVLVMIQRAIQDVTSKALDWTISLRQNEKVTNAVKIAVQAVVTVYNLLKQRVVDTIEVFTKWFNKLKEVAGKIETIFKPVTDTFNKIFKGIKEELQPAIDWIIEKYNWIAKSDLGKVLGLKTINDVKEAWKDAGKTVDELADKYKETEKAVEKATKAQNNAAGALRGALQAVASLEGQVAQKNEEIAEAQNEEIKDYDKIIRLIREKGELEEKLANAKVAQASAQLAAIKAENALSQSSTAALNAEAQASAEVTRAQSGVAQARANTERELKRILTAKRNDEYTKSLNALTAAMKNLETQYGETMSNLDKPIALEVNEQTHESINAYYDDLKAYYEADYDAYKAMNDGKIAELEKLMELNRQYGKDTAAQEAEINKLRAANSKKYKDMVKLQNDADKDRNKKQKSLFNSELAAYSNLMDSVGNLFQENTIAYKTTATAKALIDTFMAANSVLAQQPGGYITKAVAMAATIAAGIANVISIWKTDTKNPSVSTSTAKAATSTPVIDETPYSYARTVQSAAAEETLNQAGAPTKVYVLESDITDAQNKAKARVSESEW